MSSVAPHCAPPAWFLWLTRLGLRVLKPFLSVGVLQKLEHVAWFIAVGGFNTLSSYILYVLTLYFFNTPREIALLVGYGLGMLLAYRNFSCYVFGQGSVRAFARFIPAYGVLYSVNAVLLWGVVHGLGLSNEIGQLCLLPVVAALSYGINKLFVFRG